MSVGLARAREVLAVLVERVGIVGGNLRGGPCIQWGYGTRRTDAPAAPATTYNETMQDLIQRLLIELGEDPSREGLVKTPTACRQGVEVSHKRLLGRH